MSYILGISAFYHDSAAALINNGKIIAAAQEERFTRKKHDSNYPFNAVEFVLRFSKLKLSEVDRVVFYEKPFLKFERLLETYVALAPKGFIQFAKAINNAKICVTDSGLPKSRFGKYIEVPMCGTVLAADIPNQDQEDFKKFLIEIDVEMPGDEILDKLRFYLENDEERDKLIKNGLE